MAKLLKPMVIVLLVLSITSLVLGIMLFNQREVIKGRTQRLENATADFARSLHYDDLDRQALMDYDRMGTVLNRLNVHAALTWQELQDTIQDLANTRPVLEQTGEELRVTQNRLEAAEQRIVPLEDDLAERTAELARTNQQIVQLERDKAGLQGRVDDLELQVARIEEEKLEMAETIADQQSLIEEYEAEIFADDDVIGTPPGLAGRILIVNPDWNFVVLDVGSNNGLSLNTEMLVHRNDVLVGRVRVSNVKRRLAVAEIMGDWKQAPLQEGDHVLF